MFLVFAVSRLRVRRRWQSANLIAKICPKYIKNSFKIHANSNPKCIPNGAGWRRGAPWGRPRWRPGSLREWVRKMEGRTLEKMVIKNIHLGDFGSHFGPSREPMASQNRPFGSHLHEKVNGKTMRKSRPKKS